MIRNNKPKRRRYLLVGLVGGVIAGWYYSPNISNLVQKAREKIKGVYAECIENKLSDAYNSVKTDSIDQKV